MFVIQKQMKKFTDQIMFSTLHEEEEKEEEFEVFVHNVPSAEQMSYNDFVQLFADVGQLKYYSIQMQQRTATFAYFTKAAQRKAIQTLGNKKLNGNRNETLHVSFLSFDSTYEIVTLMKKGKWNECYKLLKRKMPVLIQNSHQLITDDTNTLLFHAFAQFYELIMMEHPELFDLMDNYADFFYKHYHINHLCPKVLLLIQLRKEVWQLRSKFVEQYLLDHSFMTDDVKKHVLFDYLNEKK